MYIKLRVKNGEFEGSINKWMVMGGCPISAIERYTSPVTCRCE